jgi:hypothetical protein
LLAAPTPQAADDEPNPILERFQAYGTDPRTQAALPMGHNVIFLGGPLRFKRRAK